MWMAYAEQGWTNAVDLRTAVERLHDQFSALKFDAEHKAVYGLEKGYSVIECSELQVKYETGVKLCDQFLQASVSITLIVFLILDVIMLVFGIMNKDKCPIDHRIPIFLIVAGATGIASKILPFINRKLDLTIISIIIYILYIFEFVWMIVEKHALVLRSSFGMAKSFVNGTKKNGSVTFAVIVENDDLFLVYFTIRGDEFYQGFFRFPLEKDRRDEWLKRCGNITLLDLSFQQLIKKTVCSIHFNEYDFVNPLRNRLVHTAVPIHFNSEQIEKSAGTIEENMSSPTETESLIVRKEVNVKTYGTASVNVNIEHASLQYESTITPHLSHFQQLIKKTVCSIHFNEYDFVNPLRNRLVHTAVPIHFNSEQIEKSAGTIEENMSSPTETESLIVRKEVNVKTYGTASVNVNIEHASLQYESTITPHLSHFQVYDLLEEENHTAKDHEQKEDNDRKLHTGNERSPKKYSSEKQPKEITYTKCSMFLVVVLSLNIAVLVVGVIKKDDCPIQDKIPLYLIVVGSMGLLSKFLSLVNRYLEWCLVYVLMFVLYLFEFIWVILGSVWIYSIYQPNFDPSAGEYCDESTYSGTPTLRSFDPDN
ncbi:hypothetical protein FQA39_LY09803 [Lamprigera yunnana]|nr:hypothetical protein FQA39_LY09803 [Lamprigera yunnana]